jgi:cysteine desulfurase
MKTPVYMDHHATTPVDPRVLEAMMPYFTEHFGNAASLQHRFGWIAKEAVENSRKKVADAIGAKAQEIIFTSGATESNNLAIKGVAEAYRSKGDHVITVRTEHKCVLESCRMLEESGWSITVLPVDGDGRVSVDAIRDAITDRTVLVSVMTANNEIGTIQPVQQIGELCKERGILFHTDATQAIGRVKMNVEEMHIDLLSCASHKMYGPKGIGALYIRSRNPRVAVVPQMDGAGHEHGIRSGTLNVPGIVGFGKAAQLAIQEMDEENQRIVSLRDLLQSELMKHEHVTVNGSREYRLQNNLNITFHGINSERLMTSMNDIAVSAGSACTSEEIGDTHYSHVLQAIGLDAAAGSSTVRFGLGRFTTEEEVQFTAQKVHSSIIALKEHSIVGIL